MINVVHIVEDLKIGGLERVISGLIRGHDRNVFHVKVWCLVRGGEIFDELKTEGADVEILGMRSERDLRFIFRLARRLRKEGIRVVHTHGYTATTIGRIAGIMAQVPVVIAHRHTDKVALTAKRLFIERILSPFTTKFICCSEAVRRHLANREHVGLGRTEVIYNGVDIERDHPCAPAGRTDGVFVVGCVASLTEHKGHRYLLEAAALVLRQSPRPVRFSLIGGGPLEQKLKDYARKLGIEGQVEFHGTVLDVMPLVARFDAAVLASTQREGLGLALLEAMSAGKPVVATEVGGITEIVTPGGNGLLVKPADSNQLAEAILMLINEPQRAREMGERGRKFVEEKFSLSKMVRSTEALYKKALRKRILFTSSFSSLQGGGQRSLLLLLEHLDRDIYDPVLLVPEKGELSDRVTRLGIPAIAMELPRLRTAAFALRAVVFLKLAVLLLRLRINLIHVESPREAVYLGILGRLLGIPVLLHARVSESSKWVDRALCLFCSGIIAVSASVARRFAVWGGQRKVAVVYNGVDLENFAPVKDQRRNGVLAIGYFGRIHPRKGIDILISAFKRLKIPARLIVQGNGESEYLKELQSKAAGTAAEFRTYAQDILSEMASVDIIVLASRGPEGLPRIVIEAMALGVIPVVSDIPESREALGEGFAELVFPAEDPAALAQRIEAIGHRLDQAQELRRRLRARAEEQFDIVKNTRKIQEVYEKYVS